MGDPRADSLWLDIGHSGDGPSVQCVPFVRGQKSLLLRLRGRMWHLIIQQYFADTTAPVASPIGWGTIEMFKKLPAPDIWNLHWVAGFLEWENLLPWMAEQAPIVWTLHDLNPLRGVWHYEPQAEEQSAARLRYEARAREIKKRALNENAIDRLVFVGPSRWIQNECRESVITENFSVINIPYGINTDIFKPRNQQLLRELYGIPQDVYVVGFVADHVGTPRKGMHLLLEALRSLARKHPTVHLLTVGLGSIECTDFKHTHLGGINNDHVLAHVYSACDVFVCPSTQDNLPNTVIESLACGTPVVGFNIGGLPDLITAPMHGRLVSLESGAQGLEEALSAIMAGNKDHMEKVRFPFGLTAQRQAQAYIELYQRLLV